MENKENENKDTALLLIGELADLAGISPKALRLYEQKDIIKPVKVDPETGYRYYSPDQLTIVEALVELQDMGFSLNEIQTILSGKATAEEMKVLFEKKHTALQETIWKAESQIEELDSIGESLFGEKKGKDFNEMSDEERAWHLAKLVRVNQHNVRQILSEVLWL
ncbi:MAG: MerR family transcriptional regulator [Clostridiales bacterium]|nr:MerR family transcriptional regulator [Clostridiales bacterium]